MSEQSGNSTDEARRADVIFSGPTRVLGVDPGSRDALVDAANETRIRQHRQMRVEQIADLLGRGSGQSRGFRQRNAYGARG